MAKKAAPEPTAEQFVQAIADAQAQNAETVRRAQKRSTNARMGWFVLLTEALETCDAEGDDQLRDMIRRGMMVILNATFEFRSENP